LRIQLPELYKSFDRARTREDPGNTVILEQPPSQSNTEDTYYPGSWTPVDNRPTKEEALQRLEDYNVFVEIVDDIVPDEVSNNIPYWIRGPFNWAPYVAEVLIEIDPLDRIQD